VSSRTNIPGRAAGWFDDRLGAAHFSRKSLNKVFPDHWSFMLGEVALYSFVILVATGVYLTLFFDPSQAKTTYTGAYAPLHGLSISHAYATAIGLSFDVRAGLLMRQMHHWAALVFVWSIIAHLCRIFFTGAFRRPREINWFVGVTMLVLALFNDFLGYSLLDDLLSGTGLRIGYGIVESVPVIGTWLAYGLFGGPWPGRHLIPRLFIVHVLIVPVLIAVLLGAHLAIMWRQKHTHFPGPGRRDDNVVGSRLWPVYTAKTVGLFAILTGVIGALGAFVQINPIWLYGPYEPASVTTYAQPDFTLGWIEGAMRLFPGWEIVIAHQYRIPAAFWPAVFFPTVTFLLLYAWPAIDKRLTGDRTEHNVIDRPRDRPGRSAFGLGVLLFYSILLLAGSQDIIAAQMNITIQPLTWTLRVLVVVAPVLFGLLSLKLLRDLDRASEKPEMPDPPEAPNEVPAIEAPSPVGPAPELLAPHERGGAPEEPAEEPVPAQASGVSTAVVSFVVGVLSLFDRRRRRKEHKQEQARRRSALSGGGARSRGTAPGT
jgi:ubiquinol-cytochrome c reductase cytochrome b subunit